jgi:hypothetical protein
MYWKTGLPYFYGLAARGGKIASVWNICFAVYLHRIYSTFLAKLIVHGAKNVRNFGP